MNDVAALALQLSSLGEHLIGAFRPDIGDTVGEGSHVRQHFSGGGGAVRMGWWPKNGQRKGMPRLGRRRSGGRSARARHVTRARQIFSPGESEKVCVRTIPADEPLGRARNGAMIAAKLLLVAGIF